MDLSQLKSLGEVAGIGGIALGVALIILRRLVGTIAGVPKDARAGLVKLIAIGVFRNQRTRYRRVDNRQRLLRPAGRDT